MGKAGGWGLTRMAYSGDALRPYRWVHFWRSWDHVRKVTLRNAVFEDFRFSKIFDKYIIYRSSNCWIRSSGEEDAEEEVRSQEVEEEKFCWVWRAKLTILVVLRKIFLLADLLIAAEIWLTQCFIIFWTFDFLTSPSTNCNFSLILWRKRFLILTPISPVVEKIPGQRRSWLASATVPYFRIFCFSRVKIIIIYKLTN